MAKDQIDKFVEELRSFHENEVRRCFAQPKVLVACASLTAVHRSAARLAQAVRSGNGVEAAATVLAHRALAVWLAGKSTIGDPQGELFPSEEGFSAEDVVDMVEKENHVIDLLAKQHEAEDSEAPTDPDEEGEEDEKDEEEEQTA